MAVHFLGSVLLVGPKRVSFLQVRHEVRKPFPFRFSTTSWVIPPNLELLLSASMKDFLLPLANNIASAARRCRQPARDVDVMAPG